MSQLDALLRGLEHLEPVNLSTWGGPAEVLVRPLSGWEAAGVQRTMSRGMSAEVNMDGLYLAISRPAVHDFSEFVEAQDLARVQAVEYGLSHSGETCTPEQAAQIPAPWVNALAAVVLRVSGFQDREDSFLRPPETEGAGAGCREGDAALRPERHSAGPRSVGADTPRCRACRHEQAERLQEAGRRKAL